LIRFWSEEESERAAVGTRVVGVVAAAVAAAAAAAAVAAVAAVADDSWLLPPAAARYLALVLALVAVALGISEYTLVDEWWVALLMSGLAPRRAVVATVFFILLVVVAAGAVAVVMPPPPPAPPPLSPPPPPPPLGLHRRCSFHRAHGHLALSSPRFSHPLPRPVVLPRPPPPPRPPSPSPALVVARMPGGVRACVRVRACACVRACVRAGVLCMRVRARFVSSTIRPALYTAGYVVALAGMVVAPVVAVVLVQRRRRSRPGRIAPIIVQDRELSVRVEVRCGAVPCRRLRLPPSPSPSHLVVVAV
jgi:hypothetical protein